MCWFRYDLESKCRIRISCQIRNYSLKKKNGIIQLTEHQTETKSCNWMTVLLKLPGGMCEASPVNTHPRAVNGSSYGTQLRADVSKATLFLSFQWWMKNKQKYSHFIQCLTKAVWTEDKKGSPRWREGLNGIGLFSRKHQYVAQVLKDYFPRLPPTTANSYFG